MSILVVRFYRQFFFFFVEKLEVDMNQKEGKQCRWTDTGTRLQPMCPVWFLWGK